MFNLDALTAEVTRQTTVKDSVIALLKTLKENQGDPVALQAIVKQFAANDTEIADAVVANTPAAAEPA